MGWHYKLMGEEYGPITAKELQEIAESGTISPDTLVRKAGLDDWVTADRVKGLFTPTSKPSSPDTAAVKNILHTESGDGTDIAPQSESVTP